MTGVASKSPTTRSDGKAGVVDDDVAGLAVLAHHSRSERARRSAARGQERLVPAAVENGPRVVGHAAVDGDVGSQALESLDRSDPVQRQAGGGDDRPSGLGGKADLGRQASTPQRTSAPQLGPLGDRGRRLALRRRRRRGRRRYSTPRSRSRLTNGASAAISSPNASSSKIWLPMCACTPTSSRPFRRLSSVDRLGRSPRSQGETELRVLLPGHHVLVCVRLDAGSHPDQKPRPGPPVRRLHDSSRSRPKTIYLVEGVDHDPADSGPASAASARRRTCCCRGTRGAPRRPRRPVRQPAHRRSRRRGPCPPRARAPPSPCTGRLSSHRRPRARSRRPPRGTGCAACSSS